MNDDSLMHAIARWNWIATVIAVVAIIGLAVLGNGGMASW